MSPHSRQAQERAENRRLRDVVEHYQGCVGSLNSRSQRLLSLRAGLHGSPRSAGAVARILHVSAGREQLLERMSLLALQTAGRGGCAGSPMVRTVPGSGPDQLTSTAPWVTASSAAASATSGSPSATGSAAAQSQRRAAGGRSAAPVVITPAATRTTEQASAGQGAVSWPEILLLVLLLTAVSLVLVPGVRRRLLPALAGMPPAAVRSAATPVASLTAQSASSLAPTESVQPPQPAHNGEAPASTGPEPPSEPGGPALHHQRVAQPQLGSRRIWLRGHATQGALVAAVLAGGLARILKRGRGQ